MNVALQNHDQDADVRSRHALRVRRRTRAFASEECRALRHLLTVMAHGERVAMEGASLQARVAPNREARQFLRRQAWQERFHTAIFAHAAAALPADASSPGHGKSAMPAVLSDWRAQIVNALQRDRLAESLLVQQVFLEGLGHVVLRQLDARLIESDDRLSRLGRMIQRQEAQHHEFGLNLLECELRRDPSSRPRLEKIGRSLSQQAEDLLAGLSDAFEVLDSNCGNHIAEFHAGLPADVPGVAR